MNGPIYLPGRNGLQGVAARKQPAMGQHDTAPPALAPPQPQQLQQLRRQHGIAVLASLALLDPDQHPRAVDVIHLEGSHLRHPQPGAISGAESGPVFRPGRRLEQLPDLLGAEHGR